MSRLAYVRDTLGFDRTVRSRPGLLDVACSRCDALVINNMPTHERGCPNATKECSGCNARVPMNGLYCGDCS